MLRAEDARAVGPALAPLQEGLAHSNASTRQRAVRALGRLERVDLIPVIAPLVEDSDPRVRAEAYNALGQSARAAGSAAEVQTRLLDRETSEQDAAARGVLTATLGRLPYGAPEDVRRAEALLARVLSDSASDSSADALVGAAKGLEALVRVSRKTAQPESSTVERLRSAAQRAEGGDRASLARVRRLAWLSLVTLGSFDASMIGGATADDDEEVRRLAMAAAASDAVIERRASLLQAGLRDTAGPVRYEALRGWGKHEQQTSCVPVQHAVRDASPHVALLAIDLLGNGCGDGLPVDTLQGLAAALTPRPREWHRPAHALVSLAKVAPEGARMALPRYVQHPIWQVRMYAARAAAVLAEVGILRTLGGDAHDNVREAALDGLVRLEGADAIDVALGALSRGDSQLVLTAARALGARAAALDAPMQAKARAALLETLARLTAERRDTSRDPRMALLDALRELRPAGAEADTVKDLQRLLTDFDPTVAERAADVLEAWTGARPLAASPPRERSAVDQAMIDALRGIRLRLSIAGRGQIELTLLIDDAPLTALRVVTLARRRYYDELTFHRVAPNFVIQGGSPGANEYAGDGPYMRDEVGLRSHRRGTVGISTRGRDTGDAQIFVNLVDSPRLDHTYTVFAEVVRGLDIVDAVVEGDVIERVELIAPARR